MLSKTPVPLAASAGAIAYWVLGLLWAPAPPAVPIGVVPDLPDYSSELSQVLNTQDRLLQLCERAFSASSGSTGWATQTLAFGLLAGFLSGGAVGGYAVYKVWVTAGPQAVATATIKHDSRSGRPAGPAPPSSASQSTASSLNSLPAPVLDNILAVRPRRGRVYD